MPTQKTPATVSVKKRAPRKTAAKANTQITQFTSFVGPETRISLIAEAAYYRAEKRGFAPGQDAADWLAAEAEVDARLMRAESPPRS